MLSNLTRTKYFSWFLRSALVWLFLPLSLIAQHIKSLEEQYPALIRKLEFRTFTVKDGLTANYFRGRLLVDSRGYIWIGTFDGVNRFDGYKFDNFRHNPLDSNSLVGNGVNAIFEDHRGVIRLGTRTVGGGIGLHHYDQSTKIMYRHTIDFLDTTVRGVNAINCIYEDQRNTLWIGTTNGLYEVRYQSNSDSSTIAGNQQLKFVKYSHDPRNPASLSNDSVVSIRDDAEPALWIRTKKGVDRLDPRTGLIVRFREDPRVPDPLVGKHITEIYEDRSGLLWLCTDEGLYMVKKNSGSFTHFKHNANDHRSLSNDLVYTVHQDLGGAIWVGTYDGLNEIDPDTRKVVRHLPGANVISIVEDRAENLWIGTNGSGLSQLTKRARQIKTFTLAGHWSSRLDIAHEASGGLWTNPGDADGVIFVDGTAGTKAWRLDLPDFYVMLPGKRHGELWFDGRGKGLGLMDRTGAFSFYQYNSVGAPPTTEKRTRILHIHRDSQGYLWLATANSGLVKFDPNARTVMKRYGHNPNDSTSISSDDVISVIEDDQHFFWVATGNGLNRFDPLTEKFTHWLHSPEDSTTLSSSTINCLADGKDGSIWVGTSMGVNRFDKKTGTVQRFFRGSGNVSNFAHQILKDGSGNIWVGYHSHGFSKVDVRTGRFTTFTERDGLRSEMFNGLECAQRQNGEMIMQNRGGSVVFHPDSLYPSTFIPPIVLTSFSVFDRSITLSVDSVSYEPITMPHDSNFFAFEFISLDLTVPERNQHAYKLEGYEDNWNYVGNKREARYTKVPPGEYVFRVKGSNSDGVWNEKGTFVRIIITPPWWKTIWAYLGYGFVIVGVLYSIRRSEKNRDRHKHQAELEHARAESLQEVDSLKSRFFANISHEFRTPLTLILGPIAKWKEASHPESRSPGTKDLKSTGRSDSSLCPDTTNRDFVQNDSLFQDLNRDMSLAERNAQRLLRLINQLLDLSKLESGAMKLRASHGDIVPFVKGLASSFESSADMRRVAVSFHADSDEIEVYFDRDKMEKILTNLLSNAFKFTPEGGEVTVQISNPKSQIPNHIEITIADTGIGIPADELPRVFDRFYQVDSSQTREHEGSGIGLALTKELVELHYGTISVKSEVGKGTEFTVRLALGREHLKDEEIIEENVILTPAQRDGQVREEESATESQMLLPTVGRDQHDKDSVGQKPLVLIVEDNADVRAYMREYLAAVYDVQEAHDGAEGIEKAKETIPDLIISDVMMPKKDGYELCKTLKLDEKTNHIPIILLTAKAGTENKIEGLETGADDYLTKPFDAKELLVRVKNLIDLRRKLRERFSLGQVLKPGEIAVTSADDQFLQKAMAVVEKQISNEKFSVDDFAKDIGMSRTQLHRKLTALTSQSTGDFIRYIRLHRAKQLLEQNAGTVAEIAFQVGFSSAAYFTKCFREQFGVVPSNLRNPQEHA